MREVLVVNASPLIFLGNARRLDLLQGIGARQILVPEPVFKEVTLGGHADVAATALLQATWCERAEAKAIPPSVLEWDLGPGESSVISLALQMQRACAVLDDLNGSSFQGASSSHCGASMQPRTRARMAANPGDACSSRTMRLLTI